MLINKLFEITGKDNLAEIWPNLELYVHGGVSFTPYRNRFKSLIRNSNISYLETYNASEGFIGIQDSLTDDSLLLMLDYGIYYEFMPMQEYGKEHPRTVSLSEVDTETNYALVITTNAGLWRYIIGDTVRFTSTSPYRFLITGRTRHFINAFGEELVIENADYAISQASQTVGRDITDYTVAPVFFDDTKVGTHEWLVEFDHAPEDIEAFTEELDRVLKSVNSDYEAKRSGSIAITRPIVRVVPRGTFNRWLKNSGKLGGQHKVPRLSNTRDFVDAILNMQVANS
jgi:hypothetical protein